MSHLLAARHDDALGDSTSTMARNASQSNGFDILRASGRLAPLGKNAGHARPLRIAFGLLCVFAFLFWLASASHADESDRGRRLTASEITHALTGHTFLGNVGKLQMPIRAYVEADKTFKMSASVEWVDIYDNNSKKTHVLDEHGSWWLQGNLLCLKFEKRLSGAQDCFRVYRTPADLRFFFHQCTNVSTDYCQTSEPAFIAALTSGNTVLPPTPPAWVLHCTAGCRQD